MQATYNQEGRLNLRMGPGLNYPIVGRVETGAVFTVTGRTEDAEWLQVESSDGNLVWIFYELVETNYPTAAAMIVTTPRLPTEYVIADSVADFSAKQGDNEWRYAASKSPGSLEFDLMPWDGTWYRWCCSPSRRNPEMRISAEGTYPSRQSDVMRLWVSLYASAIRIEGRAAKEAGAGYGGNGVVLRIVLRRPDDRGNTELERELWYSTLGPYDTSGYPYAVEAFEIRPRDEIYFITSANGNDSTDNTIFTSRIILLNEGGVIFPPTPTPTPTAIPAPVPPLCFEPRLRHFEEHKGCCGEVVGIAYTNGGRLSWGQVRIEGPPADDQYRLDFPINRDGGYEITALTAFPNDTIYYTIWLVGARIRSDKYVVRYEDAARIRAVVDFYQRPCR